MVKFIIEIKEGKLNVIIAHLIFGIAESGLVVVTII